VNGLHYQENLSRAPNLTTRPAETRIMQLDVFSKGLAALKVDCVVVGVFEGQ